MFSKFQTSTFFFTIAYSLRSLFALNEVAARSRTDKNLGKYREDEKISSDKVASPGQVC